MCLCNVLDGLGAVLFADLQVEEALKRMNLDRRAARTVRAADGATLAIPQKFDKMAMHRAPFGNLTGNPDQAIWVREAV